jgi:sulfide:quinone oxidoreductase
MTPQSPPEILVAGGGIAALEFVLALRDMAGDRVAIALLSAEPDLLVRPMLVAEPLHALVHESLPLAEIGADVGFNFRHATVSEVDGRERRVLLRGGGALPYATLVLAPGAQRLPAFDEALHIGDEAGTRGLETLREEILAGTVRSVAFVAPTVTGWLLPLYEAALLTARLEPGVKVSLLTPEETPLELFGDAAVARALAEAGVEFVGGRRPGAALPAVDRIVSLPMIRGPRIPGVPATGLYGLIGVDEFGRVEGLANAYAIGDATDHPIKQGGLAAQQADAAAAHIAAAHGAPVTPSPFRPRLRATLLTGAGDPIELGDPSADAAPGKLPGRYLAPYLASRG